MSRAWILIVLAGCWSDASVAAGTPPPPPVQHDEPEITHDALSETMQVLLDHQAALDACVPGAKILLKVTVSAMGGTTRSIPSDSRADLQHCVDQALEGVVFARSMSTYTATVQLGH